jgi:hypothetical protein
MVAPLQVQTLRQGATFFLLWGGAVLRVMKKCHAEITLMSRQLSSRCGSVLIMCVRTCASHALTSHARVQRLLSKYCNTNISILLPLPANDRKACACKRPPAHRYKSTAAQGRGSIQQVAAGKARDKRLSE